MDYIFKNSVVIAPIVLLIVASKGSDSYRVKSEKDAVAYLTNYGYVDPQEMPLGFTLKDCNKKLKEFQKLARVDVTGTLDASTMKAMNFPRCGCPDFINLSFKETSDRDYKQYNHSHNADNMSASHRYRHYHSHKYHERTRNNTNTSNSAKFDGGRRRSKRYVLSNRKWEKEVITYSIVKYPSRYDLKISTREIENAIQAAFTVWEQHANLKFQYQPNEINVDIEISFSSTYHDDPYPFDGPGNTLAHAFFPGSGLGGDVHFEEDEEWRLGTYSGIDLLYVAVHEIGHSLGLGHSLDYGSIMYPIYRGYIQNIQLHTDDIRGIQALYGRPDQSFIPTTSPTTSTTTTTTKKPFVNNTTTRTSRPNHESGHLCEEPEVDAITTIFGDAVFVFQGNHVYEIGKNGEGVLPDWPKDISSYFRGLEGHIDCSLTRLNGKTYFFKGEKYWRFTGRQVDVGYPRKITEYFPGIPNNLDAAFEWDEEFVFVKGDKFWRYNTRRRPQVSSYFPMSISHWGLNQGINAAFTAPNGSVYFFQDPYFWEFNKNTHKIVQNPPRTSVSSESWFGCWEP